MITPAPSRIIPVAYGLVHAVIDATTVSVVFGAAGLHRLSGTQAFWLVVGYDVLAFGSQAIIGLVTDRLRIPRATAFAGVVVALLSVVALPLHAVTAMLLASAGNALFHVGAGALALSVEPERAAAPGIFVAPGALGLAVGLRVGRGGPFATWPFFLALAVSLAIVAAVGAPPAAKEEAPPAPARVGAGGLVAALLLFSIAVRSFVGLSAFPKIPGLAIWLPLAAFGGKALGGILSDRFGWTRTSVGALVISAPIIAFAAAHGAAMVAGMFLFQMTMPVTLAALMRVLPRRPAFVFGLACLALIGGAVPTFSGHVAAHYSAAGFFALIVLSAVTLFFGLRLLGGDREGPRVARVPAPGMAS